MIVSVRVDDRLVHGQVVTNWIKSLNVNSVVVANDLVADDEMQKTVTKMALGGDIKSIVTSIEKSIKLLNDPRCDTMRILVVCKSIHDAYLLSCNVSSIKDVNIANYYRDADPNDKSKKSITKTLKINSEEADEIRKIVELGVNCYTQSAVTDSAKKLKNFI